MRIADGIAQAIGHTPLIRLRTLSEATGCDILAKAEFLNPGGSVKDRAALYLIRQAEASGQLRPGGTVVEGTAGNTGIGLAHLCNALGYRCLIVIPETQSREKLETLALLGAEVKTVPAVPYRDPNNYVKEAARIAESMDNAVWANQFDNTANRLAHYETTGPELWQQTDGRLNAFICATGTGGSLAGIARYLKERNDNITIGLADPPGSALAHWIETGELKVVGEGSVTEGIGNSRLTENLKDTPIDCAVMIEDTESISMVFKLLYEEGLLVGTSSGLNVAAAVWMAKRLGPGHRIATLLCDSGLRYRSRLFNKAWLESRGLPVPDTLQN